MSPFLRDEYLENDIEMLHKNTLQLLEVLVHDFPEFLCKHHYDFCGTMKPHCQVMRNMILHPSPSNIPVPDSLTPDMNIDTLPEIAHPPCISNSFAKMIHRKHLSKKVICFLLTS